MIAALKSLNLKILLGVIGLVAVGVLTNYSTSYAEGEIEFSHFYRQLVWGAIGLIFMMGAVTVPTKYFQSFAYVAYALGIVGLLGVIILGQSAMGAKRWIMLGPFQLQPSEFAKLTTLLGLARFISDYPRHSSRTWLTAISVAMAVVPMGLVLVEPDMGTSLIFPMMLFAMLAWGGAPGWHLLLLLAPVAAVLTSWNSTLTFVAMVIFLVFVFASSRKIMPLLLTAGIFVLLGSATPHLWNKLHPYQQKRLITFINPESDPLGSAYQLIQSKIAIGSGGPIGKGFLCGTQTQLKFLPAGHTDFIFSAFGEEFGFFGTFFVTGLLFMIFYQGMRLAARCHNSFYSLIAVGVVSMLAAQSITNLLMTVGYLPVTGVPLPLISYGGSSLIAWMMMCGLLLGVSLRWREY